MNYLSFFRHKIPLYRQDPALYFREVLQFAPDNWQKAAAKDLADYPRVTIRSGQGVGKTAFEAACVLWFLTCFPDARVVATAPTRQQLHDVLWSEISKWQAKSPLLSKILKWTKTYVYVKGNEKRWFAVARTATRPENMQGFHEDNMLFIVDEASGVADPILEAVLGTLTGRNNKLLLCGNPTQVTGVFHDSHTKDISRYRVHKVNSLDSPRTSRENIQALIDKFGAESNVVRVRVLGEFPLQEDDVFIPAPLVEWSVKQEWEKGRRIERIDIAADIARFGDDKTVIGYKVDEKVMFYKKIQGQDTMQTVADIVFLGRKLREEYGFTGKIPIKVDDGGVGGGVVDRLREMKRENPGGFAWMELFPVTFGVQIKHRYYHDSTTYMMSVVRDLLEEQKRSGTIQLLLPDDADLVGQLSGRKYEMTSKSKQLVESKKKMKERGMPSPDEADCVLLLCLPVKIRKERGNEN